MANSINQGLSWSVNGASRMSSSVTDTADGLVQISDLTVSGPVTNTEYDISIPADKYVRVIMKCTSAATVKTNDSGSPDNEFTLAAGVAEIFTQNAKGITTTVTKLYLSVAATEDFDFTVDALIDTTP